MADSRFSALSKDPRYRLPSRKEARTAVDPRFGRLFTDQDFRKKASVDRYGRKIKADSGKKELEKLYRLDEDGSAGAKTAKPKKPLREVVGSSEEDSEDEEAFGQVEDPARQGGFAESSSSEEESSEEESDEEDELELAEQTAGQEQTEDIPLGDVSRRIAAVNLDWDNIRAIDLMVVASSFAPNGGKVERVSIYPSEFGRERLEREEIEGPPKEIFANSKKGKNVNEEAEDEDDKEDGSEDETGALSAEELESDADSEDDEKIRRQLQEDQVDEGDEFDTAKLREYQLERLQYYYAVITCDSEATAKALYDEMDGREYLSSANFFDLRFIPDETSFDDDTPREECTKTPEGYRPNEFKTQALTHSKVRLTWDDDDATRKEVQKRAFSRAEIDANDLRAYIGSDDDSSDAGSATSRKSSTAADRRAAKKEAERVRMRAALGLAAEPTKSDSTSKGKNEPIGDMQITFTSGLSGKVGDGKKQGVFENESSTREQYIRKERERKAKRKEKMRTARGEEPSTTQNESEATAAPADEDQGFNDPFFADPEAATKQAKKAARKSYKAQRDAAISKDDAEAQARRDELALLMAGDDADGVRHFDLRAEEQAAKAARKAKGKGGAKAATNGSDVPAGAEAFQIEAQDPRFAALFASHEYAIDPSNPRYKATDGMKALLEEGRRKRKKSGEVEGDGMGEERKKTKTVGDGKGAERSSVANAGASDVAGLVAKIKRRG